MENSKETYAATVGADLEHALVYSYMFCGQRLWCVAAGKELPAMTVIAGLQTAATAMLRAMEYGYRNVTVRKEA